MHASQLASDRLGGGFRLPGVCAPISPEFESVARFSWAAGIDRPLGAPRVEPNPYWDSVSPLSVSTLCLLKNQVYRRHCILISDPKHVSRPDQLTAEEWAKFTQDAHVAVKALAELFRPDHITSNV